MKKTDLDRRLASRLDAGVKGARVPDRYAQAAAAGADKRERRRRDALAGLVPFACKLPASLAARLAARGASVEGGVDALVAQALEAALGGTPEEASHPASR